MALHLRSAALARTMAFVGAAGVVVGTCGLLFSAAGPASAADATLTLNYSCPFPLIGTQTLSVTIDATLPDNVVAGQATAPFTFTAAVTVPDTATQGLSLVGATSVSGTATASSTLTNGSASLPPLSVPLTVAATPVPTSGSFTVNSTGSAPSITLPDAGTATITVGDFATTLTPVTATGAPTGLGTFTSACTQLPGQANVLATFPVAAGDGGGTTTEPPPTTTTAAPPTTTTDAPPTTTEPTTVEPTTTTEPTTTDTTTGTATDTSPPTETTTASATVPTTVDVGLANGTPSDGGGTGSGSLPFTGVDVFGPVLVGLALLVAGVGALLVQRRRRSGN
jgi:hypothetical protein